MDRRKFTQAMGAAVAGMTAGSRLFAEEKVAAKKADEKAPKHICKGHNECKGQGGCASDAARHSCAGKNECKGMGGCKSGDAGCAGKNSCKGKGGCEVPVKHLDSKKKDKAACSGKNGCKAA
jgi:hypothetical protein